MEINECKLETIPTREGLYALMEAGASQYEIDDYCRDLQYYEFSKQKKKTA